MPRDLPKPLLIAFLLATAVNSSIALSSELGSLSMIPRQITPEELRAAEHSFTKGGGCINGKPTDVAVSSAVQDIDAFVANLRLALRGRFTVIAPPTEDLTQIVIADLMSPLCPNCTPLTDKTLPLIFDRSFVLTVIAMGNGQNLVFGTSAYALRGTIPASGLAYAGNAWRGLADQIKIVAQSDFSFGSARSVTASLHLTSPDSVGQMEEALVKNGFVAEDRTFARADASHRFFGSAAADAATNVQIWRRGQTVLTIQPRPVADTNKTTFHSEVLVNELTVN